MDLMSCYTSSFFKLLRGDTPLTVASETGNLCIMKALLRNDVDINKCNGWSESPLCIASCKGECDVGNGDRPSLSHKLISAPKLSKHLTTSHFPLHDALSNEDCPCLSNKLISAPELSKHLTTICVTKMDDHHCL
jgi:ankyrin repeat protein